MSWLSDQEKLVDTISDWAVGEIQDITHKLSPDGRPFGVPDLSPDDQLALYMKLRGNPEAWLKYIIGKVTDLINSLEGMPPDELIQVAPYDIVATRVIAWSADMEALIAKKASNATIQSGEQASDESLQLGRVRDSTSGQAAPSLLSMGSGGSAQS